MGLSIAVATGLYRLSFRALAVAAGLTVWPAMALPLLMFPGRSPFPFIRALAAGGAGPAAAHLITANAVLRSTSMRFFTMPDLMTARRTAAGSSASTR